MPKQKLAQHIKNLCLIKGEAITLASGKKSQFYFNMKRLAADPQAMRLASGLLLEQIIRANTEYNAEYIGGLEMGAVPLIAAILTREEAETHHLRGFYIRKQAKGHGLKKRIEGLADEAELNGKKIIILEDVTTTGGSAMDAVQVARSLGGEVLEIITLLDREEGAQDNMKKEGLRLTSILRARDILEISD